MNTTRFQRQILAFGEEGQARLSAHRVAIVGLGGLGCFVAQSLANLGIRRFVLVDDDRLSESNRNRWVLGFPADVGELKVDLVRRYILAIDSSAEVMALPVNLRTKSGLSALLSCSTIFGCVDNDGPRLVLSELAAAYEIPLIDSASEIIPPKELKLIDFGGRVVVARPGDFCLFCAGELDAAEAKAALEPAAVQDAREAHGYGLGLEVESPSVVSLNGVIGNLAVTEFMAMVTGIREPVRKLSYRGMRGVVTASSDRGLESCYTCRFLKGAREQADIFRYAVVASAAEAMAVH